MNDNPITLKNMYKLRKIRDLGNGTFGNVELYDGPTGRLVGKSTKLHDKYIGYSKDLINELDALIKFQKVLSIVSIKAIYLDADSNQGYLFMEEMDTDLSKWISNTRFYQRIKQVENLIFTVGGALALMNSMNYVHNDIKLNNILVKSNGTDITFKLADFGKAKYIYSSGCKYGGLDEYRCPMEASALTHEYWAFAICLTKLIVGKQIFNKHTYQSVYKQYIHHGSFKVKNFIKDNISDNRYREIPKLYWSFTEYVFSGSTIGLHNVYSLIGYQLSDKYKQLTKIQDDYSIPVEHQPHVKKYMKYIQKAYQDLYKPYEHIQRRYECLMGNFYNRCSKITSETSLKFAEIGYIIVVGSNVANYKNFDSISELLEYERKFLYIVNYQTLYP